MGQISKSDKKLSTRGRHEVVLDTLRRKTSDGNERNAVVVLEKSGGNDDEDRPKRTHRKIQLELGSIMSLSHLTQEEAAIHLRVSARTLRKRCREYGMKRWPPNQDAKKRDRHVKAAKRDAPPASTVHSPGIQTYEAPPSPPSVLPPFAFGPRAYFAPCGLVQQSALMLALQQQESLSQFTEFLNVARTTTLDTVVKELSDAQRQENMGNSEQQAKVTEAILLVLGFMNQRGQRCASGAPSATR